MWPILKILYKDISFMKYNLIPIYLFFEIFLSSSNIKQFLNYLSSNYKHFKKIDKINIL